MKRKLIMGVVQAKYPRNSAGHQCSMLHWLLGFRQLGWDVWIVEDMNSAKCQNEEGFRCSLEESINLISWQRFVTAYGFENRETLFLDGQSETSENLRSFAKDADLFLNFAGQFPLLEMVNGVRCKAYLDVDPGFTQTWAVGYGCNMNFNGHDEFVTIGSAINSRTCRIPETGHDWTPTLPPVVPELYQNYISQGKYLSKPWTTIAHWYGTNEVSYRDLTLPGKRDSFLQMADLPLLTTTPIVVASDMETHWEDHSSFIEKGWQFQNALKVCESMESYLDFINNSQGEIGVAKGGYISARTGWISDRSLVYLACGKPVLAMDTGWPEICSETMGLQTFRNAGEAAHKLREIENNYEEACLSAHDLARTRLSARVIIPELLSKLGLKSEVPEKHAEETECAEVL